LNCRNKPRFNKDVLSVTARLYVINQQMTEAADVYAKYVQAAPDDIEIRFVLANMLVEQSRTEKLNCMLIIY